MRAASRLVNFLLTGICLTPDYEILKRNNTLKREVELLSDAAVIPQDVCLLPDKNVLAGKKLTIATWQDWPASGTRKDEKGRENGDGFAFEFVEILREKFGFSYDIILPEENILGDATKGMFGLLYNKRADMAAALLPVTPSTLRLATPSVPLAETEFVILMKRPVASATGSGLLAPFTTTVWLLILVSLIAVGPIMFLIMKLRDRVVGRRRPLLVPGAPDEPQRERYSLGSCVWFVYGALMKQGSVLSPRADSTRLLFATWWLFILVLTAYYTANLTAFLTLSKFTLPIDGPRDIPAKRYRWFAEKGSILQHAISNDSDLGSILQYPRFEFLPYQNDSREEKILKFVTEDNLVFLEERRKVELLIFRQYVKRTAQNVKEVDRCKLAMTPRSFMTQTLAFFYPFNSTLAKLFDKTLTSLLEAGIIKFRQRMALPLNQICPLDLRNKERQLRNADLATTYKVIGSGFAAGIIAFCTEYVVQRWHRKRALRRAASAQRKLLGSPVGQDPLNRQGRKRVRLQVPATTRYPGDASHMLVLPAGPGQGSLDKIASKAHFYPTNSPADFIFR